MRACILIMILVLLSPLVFAQGFESDEARAERVVVNTAQSLGWPTSTGPRPGSAGTSYQVTPTGGYSEEPSVFAFIAVMTSDTDAQNVLQLLQDNGMTRGTFHGRQAIIMQQGDQICNPKEGTTLDLTFKAIKWIAQMIASEMGTTANDVPLCADSYGTVVWRCGKYVFGVQDQTGYGNEKMIANALYAASEGENLCGIGDTVVILTGTADKMGTKKISNYQQIADGVNTYYSWNAYNRVDFTFTFKDADGSSGTSDWYNVGPAMATYSSSNTGDIEIAQAALKKAFAGTDLGSEVYLDRVVIVYPGPAAQEDANAPFSTACRWRDPNYFVEVDGAKGKSKIYVRNIILVSEQDTVGDWAHEFGHSLYSKHAADGTAFFRINDRYNYAGKPAWQYGNIDTWGLMGNGNYWGSPKGSAPTHMSAFTKEGAGWLRYQGVSVNNSYTETAIENKDMGEFTLVLDDPRSADPEQYYIIEARDASATYGAPESGLNIYFVRFDHPNKHYVVNLMTPQSMPTVGSSDGRAYPKPTLYSTAGNGSVWKSVTSKFQIVLTSETGSPYTATFKIEEFKPANLAGAVAAPAGAPAVPNPQGPNPPSRNSESQDMPDIDLHAYDSAGRHVGMNYQTGEYELQIPEALASGDMRDSEEWIFVPEGTMVRYELSAERTKRFLQQNPEYSSAAQAKEVELEYYKYDAFGNGQVASGGTVYVDHKGTATVTIKSYNDPSLTYIPQEMPGFGNNDEGCCCIGFILPALLLVVIFIRRK
ncbi:MAG: hypothetical protein ABII71_03815 [Candidatus Micrarchaeota archaeon]